MRPRGAVIMAAPKMVDGVVAKGRTIRIGNPAGEDGQVRVAGPGEKVSLSKDDAAWLMSCGFLEDSGAVAIPTADGPSFGTIEGPTVQGI